MNYVGKNIAGRKPDELMKRTTMWCARRWAESLNEAVAALARKDHAAHRALRADADEWMQALVIVNRVALGVEPHHGACFLDGEKRAS
jgi:hypothetical protein